MKLHQLIENQKIDEYSKVINAYLSLIIQNSHLVGTGGQLETLGIDTGVEKQTLRREINVIWAQIDQIGKAQSQANQVIKNIQE